MSDGIDETNALGRTKLRREVGEPWCTTCGWPKLNHPRWCRESPASVMGSLPSLYDRIEQPPYPTEGERLHDTKPTHRDR